MTGTRLNDCTPTPEEQARYTTPDAREAQMRRNHSLAEFKNGWGENKTGHKDGLAYDHWKEKDDLFRLLDEARAQAAEYKLARQRLMVLAVECLEKDTEIEGKISALSDELEHIRCEARASALEEAAQLCDDLWVGSQGKSVLAPKIRALINEVKS